MPDGDDFDNDAITAAAARLLESINAQHVAWLEDELARGTDPRDALAGCIDVYLELIRSVVLRTNAPENLRAAEEDAAELMDDAWLDLTRVEGADG